MNLDLFYSTVRSSLFGGKLNIKQVEGMSTILKEWKERQLCDLRWLAYMLATTYHETAKTMQPIEEYGKGRNYPYGKPDPISKKIYYGRGFVQLTWKYNYQSMSKIVQYDLVQFPEMALDLRIATKILFEGMIRGSFTGKKLSDYFDSDTEDWVNARRIINGTDKAELISDYAKSFYKGLTAVPKRVTA